MRIRKVSALLILMLSLTAVAAPFLKGGPGLGGAPGSEDVAIGVDANLVSHQTWVYFNKRMGALRLELQSLKDYRDRLKAVRKALGEIQYDRSLREMADVETEIHMGIVIDGMRELPDVNHFDKSQCDFYQKEVLRNYEPSALDTGFPENPGTAEVLGLVQLICR